MATCAAVAVLGSIVTYFLTVETRGISLEEVDAREPVAFAVPIGGVASGARELGGLTPGRGDPLVAGLDEWESASPSGKTKDNNIT